MPTNVTNKPAVIRISTSQLTNTNIAENGSKIATIAKKCPAANMTNAFGNALFFSCINAEDIARGHPIPGFIPWYTPEKITAHQRAAKDIESNINYVRDIRSIFYGRDFRVYYYPSHWMDLPTHFNETMKWSTITNFETHIVGSWYKFTNDTPKIAFAPKFFLLSVLSISSSLLSMNFFHLYILNLEEEFQLMKKNIFHYHYLFLYYQ
mgnify:CR=1 FL=1